MHAATPRPFPPSPAVALRSEIDLPFPDVERRASLANRAFELDLAYGALPTTALLDRVVHEGSPGGIALVSSFGAESAVLLHLVAQVEPALPVIFLDTGKLFDATLHYRDRLVARLGLSDVRTVLPDPAALALEDGDSFLFERDPNRCCTLRKVRPLEAALRGFEAWITGRKAFQGGERIGLPLFESDGRRVKVNPLARWSREDILAYFEAHDLPRHPLEADGFASIGCRSCSQRALPGEDPRAGRWKGQEKTECGIHWPSEPGGPAQRC